MQLICQRAGFYKDALSIIAIILPSEKSRELLLEASANA